MDELLFHLFPATSGSGRELRFHGTKSRVACSLGGYNQGRSWAGPLLQGTEIRPHNPKCGKYSCKNGLYKYALPHLNLGRVVKRGLSSVLGIVDIPIS